MLDLLLNLLLPAEVSIWGLIGCGIAIALGGFLRGFLGFGAALLIVPILSTILTPAMGLVILYLIDVPTNIYLMPPAIKKGNVRKVLPMIIAILCTIPIGFYFVYSIDPEIIRIVISFLVICMVILLASGWKPKGEIKIWTMIMGGSISGLVNGAAGVGGPPYVTVLMARNDNVETTRSNIILTMGFMSLFTLLTQIFYGMVSFNLVKVSIIAFPIYLGFTWFGARYFNKSGSGYFRKGALIMLITIALVTIGISTKQIFTF
jgi:uncharacterized membrane protein YfcA